MLLPCRTGEAIIDDIQPVGSAHSWRTFCGNCITDVPVIRITKVRDSTHRRPGLRGETIDLRGCFRRRQNGTNSYSLSGDPMMEELHQFRVVAWWASGRTGIAKSASAPNVIHFTAAPEFGGLDGRWTPEDLLLSAVASCYTNTFRVVAESSKFVYLDLQVEVEGDIQKADPGYQFSEIIIRPRLTISAVEDEARAIKLLQKARELCLVSRALSVEQRFEAHVQVGQLPVHSGQSLLVSDGKEGFV